MRFKATPKWPIETSQAQATVFKDEEKSVNVTIYCIDTVSLNGDQKRSAKQRIDGITIRKDQ